MRLAAMLEMPIVTKIIPIAIAGLIAVTPIADVAKITKDSNTTTNEKGSDNQTTVNDKTNQQTTKIVTIREGFKGVILDGKIFEVPYKHVTTVEKTYHEKEQEKGQQEKSSDNSQGTTSRSTEEVPSVQTTILTKITDSGKWFVQKIWQKVKP